MIIPFGFLKETSVFSSGLITNGDFETDITSWNAKSCVISRETSSPIFGSGSISADTTTGNDISGMWQDGLLFTGNTYRVTGTMKLVSGDANGTIRINSIKTTGFSQTLLGNAGSIAIGETKAFTLDFSISDPLQIGLQFACTSFNAVFLIDNVSLITL